MFAVGVSGFIFVKCVEFLKIVCPFLYSNLRDFCPSLPSSLPLSLSPSGAPVMHIFV